ncbi:MFS transporter [Streptomyces avicenniae]|uniref:MFS transporter n=1 Tax=Streptomyces avicenniae TaxID=500153 RepID=UPI00069B3FE4|nr:MFS transporter [Streptomyces avicenniae]
MSAGQRGGLLRRHRDFRLLWCGETTGKYGASVTSVAMPLVAVSTLDANAFQVGLLSASAWAPWLLIGLPAGAWIDRMRRRPVMLAAAAVSCVLFALVPLAAWAGRLSLGLLLAVALLGGTAAVFFQTAYSAYLPGLLDPADQAEGNAALHGSASAAQIAGLGSAGLIAQAAGTVNAMAANAATFLVSLLCLARIRHREPRPTPARRALTAEVADGLRLVGRDRWLRAFTLYGAATNLALMGYQSIQFLFLVRTLGMAPGTVGALIAVTGAGGVVGALAARRTAAALGTARAALLFALPVPSLALLMPLATGGAGVALFAIGGFGVTAGIVAVNILKSGFQQRWCPPALLGRLTASGAFLTYGAVPLGALLGGWLGTVTDLRTAMFVTTAAVPLAGLLLLFSPLRHVRDLPTRPAATATPAPLDAERAER